MVGNNNYSDYESEAWDGEGRELSVRLAGRARKGVMVMMMMMMTALRRLATD